MCGIAGLIPADPDVVPRDVLSRWLGALAHRGPDDRGYLAARGRAVQSGRDLPPALAAEAVLLHRRLAILDLTDAGWQPMSTADGRYHLVYNGEVYNHIELRTDLARLGRRFASRCDTEVLLKALAQWGTRALPRLDGMFAFAVLDTHERTLTLARDPLGIKPLYYVHSAAGFAFASEIKPLLQLPGVDRAANPARVYQYVRWGITDHGGETMFRAVRQLPAAHYLTVSLDGPRPAEPACYWRVDLNRKADLSFAQAAERLRELFLDSVRRQLRSDVPVGATLSGGVDSSSIVMAVRHLEPHRELHTFSYLADDAVLDEGRWVDIVARAAGTVMHKVQPSAAELVGDLEQLITSQEEPFGSTSIYAQYRVFRAARAAGMTVMLSGQGADEMLAGYLPYLPARLVSMVRGGRWASATRFVRAASGLPRAGTSWLMQATAEYLLPHTIQSPFRRLVGRELIPAWMNAAWLRDRGVVPRAERFAGRDAFKRELHRSLMETMLPHLLRFEDRNSMAFSLESRVPYVTTQLVEFLYALPDEYIIAENGTSKAVFRQAMRGLVPDPILNRRDKIGFETPEKAWFTALRPWIEGVLDSAAGDAVAALDVGVIRRMWHATDNGTRSFDKHLWRWINLIEWSRLFGVTYD